MGQLNERIMLFCIFFSYFVLSVKGQNDTGNESGYMSSVKVHTCCNINIIPGEDCNNSTENFTLSFAEETLGFSEHRIWTAIQYMTAENITVKFPLATRKVTCANPKIVHFPTLPQDLNSLIRILKNGYLRVDKEYYPPDEFCLNGMDDTAIEVQVCPQTESGSRPFIRKCCGLDKVYSYGLNGSRKGCLVPKGDYFKPVFYNNYNQKSSKEIPDPFFLEHYPTSFRYSCPENKTTFYLFPEASDYFYNATKFKFNALTYRVGVNGKIIFKDPRDGRCRTKEFSDICIDRAINYGKRGSDYDDDRDLVMFQCAMAVVAKPEKYVVGILYGGIMLFSSIFLLLTVLTYAALWERQSVHGWTIVSHTVSLFMLYIFLGVSHIIGVTLNHKSLGSMECISIGILTHFFFLSTFCWLFLIGLDLWLTFRAFTPRAGTTSKGFKRFMAYSVFGWGCPLVFVIVGIILDFKQSEHECHNLLTPGYGMESCYLQQKAVGVYIYWPIAVMIVLNLVFFAITTAKLYLYRQSTKIATKDDNQLQFYRLFLKLFFVMGVLWVFEVISWATHGHGFQWYWFIFDLLNILRALAVFIIFVCKRDIIFALEGKYPCLKPILLPFGWLFKRRHTGDGDSATMMTRTSTMRQTMSSDGKPESIRLTENSSGSTRKPSFK